MKRKSIRNISFFITLFIAIFLINSLSYGEGLYIGGESYYNNIKPLVKTSYNEDVNSEYYNLENGKILGYDKGKKTSVKVDVRPVIENIKGRGVIPLDRQFMMLSSRFGFRQDPFKQGTGGTLENLKSNVAFHAGLDLAAPNINGANIYNFLEGTVKRISRSNSGYGNLIVIDNGNFETYYAHLSEIAPNLKEGNFVSTGDIIGKVGSTGRSTGPHLHMEIVINNVAVNPQVFLHDAIVRDEHDAYMENFIFNIVAE